MTPDDIKACLLDHEARIVALEKRRPVSDSIHRRLYYWVKAHPKGVTSRAVQRRFSISAQEANRLLFGTLNKEQEHIFNQIPYGATTAFVVAARPSYDTD